MIENYINQLRTRGYRMTPQRLVILHILYENGGHLTPLEICQRAHELMPGMTEATVYRTLAFLAGQGLILAAHIGNGQFVYETAEHAHHHLICRECGWTCEVDHALLEELYKQFEASTGFQIDSMHVTFFGTCPVCQKKS
jgi:Fe2+ or Zn2+ uptake regulation protein